MSARHLLLTIALACLTLLWGALPAPCAPVQPLKWGLDLEGGAPYAFTDPEKPDRIIGFEKELFDELSRRLKRPVQLVQTNWDSLLPALNRGTFDVAASGLEITDANRSAALFTRPYCVYQQQIVVREDDNRVLVFDDLRGKKVGTLTASAAHRMLEKLGGVDTKLYSDLFAVYQDLGIGRLDAVFIDQPVASYYANKVPHLRFIEPPLGEGYYGIAIARGNEALKRELDVHLERMIADGTLQAILKRWNLWTPAQDKLRVYHDPQPVKSAEPVSWKRYFPMLVDGALMTVRISVLSMLLAMAVGLALALLRIYGPRPAQWFATAYVELFRGTPLLIQLYLLYYGLPNLGIQLDAFVAGVLGLGLNYAANEAENYRAGIQAIPRGQSEASLALGMNRWQVLRHVILPQSFRVTLPPITNDFVALFKDSSLVSVITLVELTKAYGMLASATYDYIGLGILTALMYLAISYPATLLARWTEHRLRRA
ncbi:MAG: ABC transporter substrate-binding protein/permease [bacterium]|nr:ABC transporter substrate-binding protein/permease [bacterium]